MHGEDELFATGEPGEIGVGVNGGEVGEDAHDARALVESLLVGVDGRGTGSVGKRLGGSWLLR